jgi:hypothetical protein
LDNNKIIGWRYYHKKLHTHSKLIKLGTPTKLLVNTPYDIRCNYRFEISVTTLKDDIIDSIMRKPSGYREVLLKSKILQLNFRRAINEIYNPTKI